MVEPIARTLEVYRLESGRWAVAGMHGGDVPIRAEPFEAVILEPARWWIEPARWWIEPARP